MGYVLMADSRIDRQSNVYNREKPMNGDMRRLAGAMLAAVMAGAVCSVNGEVPLLIGEGANRWSMYDESYFFGEHKVHSARAFAPTVAGHWAANDGGDYNHDQRLAVMFTCTGFGRPPDGEPVIVASLEVMWFLPAGIATAVSGAPPMAVFPNVDWSVMGTLGWSPYAVWDVAIGSSSGWVKGIWERQEPGMTPFRAGHERMFSVKNVFVLELKGRDGRGYLGSRSSGLNAGEVERLKKADYLIFRIPYTYTRKSDYDDKGSRRKGARMVQGFHEWHVPLTGSRDAIGGAMEVCKR